MNEERRTHTVIYIVIFIAIVVGEFFIAVLSVGFVAQRMPAETYAGKEIEALLIWIAILAATVCVALVGFNTRRSKMAAVVSVALCAVPVVVLLVFLWSEPGKMHATFAYRYFMAANRSGSITDDTYDSIREAIHLNPDKPIYWSAAGDAYFEDALTRSAKDAVGYYDYAIYYYESALERKPENAKLGFLLGRAYSHRRKDGDLKLAIDCLLSAVEQMPKNAEYNFELATAYYFYGVDVDKTAFNDALEYFDAAIECSSPNAEYYYWRGNCYLGFSTYDNNLKAVEDISKAIELAPDNAKYHYWRGRAYTYLNDPEQARNAVEDFDTAIFKVTNNAEYYYWRGRAYYNIGDNESLQKAVDDYTQAIQLDDGKADYYYYRARAHHGLGNTDANWEDAFSAVERNEKSALYRNYLGILYYNAYDYESAAREFKQAAELSNSAFYYFDLGDAYYMQGRYGEAVDAYSAAIERDPSSTLYLPRRQYCYLMQGDIEHAKADTVTIMELDSHGKEIFRSR